MKSKSNSTHTWAEILSNDPKQAQLVRNLNIMVPRVEAAGKRFGAKPCRALFTIKSDQQVLDDLVYPLGVPVSRPAWWYGKAVQQSRSKGQGGHVFEFATVSNPAHVVLGETNDLMMHILVIIHAWMGHVHMFTNNIWHDETERETALQRFAQAESFVQRLVNDEKTFGWEWYEFFSDAAHALENHSGELPSNKERESDVEARAALRQRLDDLKHQHTLAKTDPDRATIESDIRDIAKTLSCHPLSPTTDLLGFLASDDNPHALLPEVKEILDITRYENRYSTQVIGRTKTIHEGVSHWFDAELPLQPELDLIRLGVDRIFDAAKYDTMHDAWPIYWYSDPYALGQELIYYVDSKHSRKIGKEIIKVRRLKLLTEEDVAKGGKYMEAVPDHVDAEGKTVVRYEERDIKEEGRIAGDLVELDEFKEVEVDVWDRTEFWSVLNTFDDNRLFTTYLTEEFFEKLHKKALGWVKKSITSINRTLREVRWDPNLIFDGDRFPQTLQEMFQVIQIWMNQLQMSSWIGQWFGYGAAPFPVSQVVLWQMLQIVQTVASYDADKNEFKRHMLLRTGLLALPNIKLVDTGRENKTPYWTLRHEFDSDFGPLKQSHARQTLRYFWRFSGPVRMLTMEILTDAYGRPVGPPRPYEYYTENGKTVKERWL